MTVILSENLIYVPYDLASNIEVYRKDTTNRVVLLCNYLVLGTLAPYTDKPLKLSYKLISPCAKDKNPVFYLVS